MPVSQQQAFTAACALTLRKMQGGTGPVYGIFDRLGMAAWNEDRGTALAWIACQPEPAEFTIRQICP